MRDDPVPGWWGRPVRAAHGGPEDGSGEQPGGSRHTMGAMAIPTAAARPGLDARRDGRSRRRVWIGGWVTLSVVVYLALAVDVRSAGWTTELDSAVLAWSPLTRWPGLEPVVSVVVLLGQRAICLAIAVAWLVVRTVRTRDGRPWAVLAVATLLLNVTVGAAKFAFNRLGPLQLGPEAVLPGASAVFTDGTVFPSGHAANAVLTWGVLAMVARRWRRTGAWLTAGLAVLVGLATVYLGTHWVSDVVAGWAAGALVLLAVPALDPVVDRVQRWSGLLFRTIGRRGPARPRSGAATRMRS